MRYNMRYEVERANIYIIHNISYEIWDMRYEIGATRYDMRYKTWDMRHEIWNMRYEIWYMRYEIWIWNINAYNSFIRALLRIIQKQKSKFENMSTPGLI